MTTSYQTPHYYYSGLEYYYPCLRGYSNPYYYPIVRQDQMLPSQVNHEMKLSARNQFKGKIVKIKLGDVLGQVLVDIGCKNLMSSVITTNSIDELGLSVGLVVKAILKSTGVMIIAYTSESMSNKENSEMKLSARNQFSGEVIKIKEGDVASQVLIDLGCGNLMSSVITTDSLHELEIKVNSKVKAVVKSTEIMIASYV